MRILVISDLNWHESSRRIDQEDIIQLFDEGKMGSGERFQRVLKYWSFVTKEKPDLVLLAGDVTGDGSCGHGYQTACFYLLSCLELAQIPTYFIRGDNDLDDYYNDLTKNLVNHRYVMDISNKPVALNGFTIYGLPFQATHSKALPETLSAIKQLNIDILLAHSALKKRTFLIGDLDIPTIITGHFDNKICHIAGTDFISLSNDSAIVNYVVMDCGKEDITYQYHFSYPEKQLDIIYTTSKSGMATSKKGKGSLAINDVPVSIEEYEQLALPNSSYEKDKNALALSIKYLRGQSYKKALNYMLEVDKVEDMDASTLRKMMKKNITSKHKLSLTMLVTYLGHGVRKILKKSGE